MKKTLLSAVFGVTALGMASTGASAATLDDVKEWFKKYYGPNNAVIVLSGDIDAEESKPYMEKYFGALQSGLVQKRKISLFLVILASK